MGADLLFEIACLKNALINVHAFDDGNGRLSRLIAQREMLKSGLMPILFDLTKIEYYHSMMSYGYQKENYENRFLYSYLLLNLLKYDENEDEKVFEQLI